MSWTREQILALAPDSGSQKAGQGLASPRKWSSLGASDEALWGECQGSGKDPYQTQIDLGEPAFRCSCPSRKFPCKHALGLFLIFAAQPETLDRSEAPAWVTEWLSGRAAKAEKKTERQAQKEEAAKTADPAAQAKRAAQREARVTSGLGELEIWLRDLVRSGLAAAQAQPYSFWEGPAARMVDAQAPGVARLVREMAGIPATGAGGQERLLERLGRLHLLLEGYKRLDSLPEETQADVRSLVGWPYPQEELLAQAGIRDRWLVLGQRVEDEERVRAQRTWLWGLGSGQPALVLHFAPFGQPLDASLVPGMCLDAEMVFFPSAYPLRGLVKERGPVCDPPEGASGHATLQEAASAYGEALSRNPWLERFPLPLREMTPARDGDGWLARDREGRAVRLAVSAEAGWRLLALSGGHPLLLFGEWSGESLLPLSAWSGERYYPAEVSLR